MTEKEFTNRIDGLINDYEGGESTSKELRNGILDTLIELVSKVSPFEARVSPKTADDKILKKEFEEKFTKNYAEYGACMQEIEPELLWQWIINIKKQAEINGWNKCYTTYLEDDSIEP